MWFIYSILISLIIYLIIKNWQNYWRKIGVIQTNPTFLIGDIWQTIIRKKSFLDLFIDIYNEFPGHRYNGFYIFLTPILSIRDPELIKQICVKDFDSFMDHRPQFASNSNPLWTKNLFSLAGQEWRDMRHTLTPAFTSSKMRIIHELIDENAGKFTKYFLEKNTNQIHQLEMKEWIIKYTMDVIANTAFGIDCNSLENPDNEFFRISRQISDFSSFRRRFITLGYIMMPKLMSMLGLQIFTNEETNFFVNLIRDTIKLREDQNIVRPDMLQMMMEARNTFDMSDMDMTAQAFNFLTGGFESVSAFICLVLHEIAVNSNVQERLYDEILEQSRYDGITYDHLHRMKYLDMVVLEGLRKWPVVGSTDRKCTKMYRIEPILPHEKSLIINEGSSIFIPIIGLHYDTNYFPNPQLFDPERFNDDNKKNIKSYTYLPFGIGPRNCIGSRFAVLETKLLIYHLVLHFKIITISKTQIPLKISKKSLTVNAENGFWLGLKRRISL